MRRRDFIRLVGAAALTTPFVAGAQSSYLDYPVTLIVPIRWAAAMTCRAPSLNPWGLIDREWAGQNEGDIDHPDFLERSQITLPRSPEAAYAS